MCSGSECIQEESRSGEKHSSPVRFLSVLIKNTLGFQIVRDGSYITGEKAEDRLKNMVRMVRNFRINYTLSLWA